jgi:hypothetical protein
VETIRFQVIREATRAADAADESDVLAPQAQLGQEVTDRVENDVVTAARAPADLLVTGEVLGLLLFLVVGTPLIFDSGVSPRSVPITSVMR